MSKEDVLASDIVSVGSCDSLIRDELDGTFEGLEAMSIYTNTHAGGCLELVLRGLMDEGEINVEQRLVLLNEFNRKYHDAFSQCNSRLRLSIHGNLAEYSSIEKGSVFEVKNCTINGPSSSLRVPSGIVKLVHARVEAP